MKEESMPDFIIIDDDSINNLICLKIIKQTIPGACVETFTDPEKGLAHILSSYSAGYAGNAVLFLDINMPFLSGWEVLGIIAEFPSLVKERLKIFMLSSSVDPKDKEKAGNNPLISGYITKSLSVAKFQSVFPDYEKHGLIKVKS